MNLYQAEQLLKTSRLRFGDEEQIKAVKLLTAAEEITSLLKDYSIECPMCDGEGDVSCPECDGKGKVKCDHCEDGDLKAPDTFRDEWELKELLGKVRDSINEALPMAAQQNEKQSSFLAA